MGNNLGSAIFKHGGTVVFNYWVLSLDLKRGREIMFVSPNGTQFQRQVAALLPIVERRAEGTVGWRKEKD